MIPSASHAALILTRAIEALSSARALDEVTAIVAEAAKDLADADGATFVLREDGMCFYADEKAIGPLWKGQRFPLGSCVSGWAITHRATAMIPDIFADERVPIDAYRSTFVRAMCMTPVRVKDPLAAIGTYWSTTHTPSPRTVHRLEMLADTAAVALENLELRGALGRRVAERDRAAERADELEAAVRSIVHDLRNPLGAVIGYADLIAEDAPEDVRRYAETIARVGERMSGKIDRLLDVFRITAHTPAPQRVDLSALAQQIAEGLVLRAGRAVEIDIQPGILVRADPTLAEALLENLLGNAVKYTGRAEHPRVSVRGTRQVDGFTRIEVEDNGVGFDATDGSLLFRPFTRLHDVDDFAGTGLGLASVFRIVQQHGGIVGASGRPGLGATFSVTLPALAGEDSRTAGDDEGPLEVRVA